MTNPDGQYNQYQSGPWQGGAPHGAPGANQPQYGAGPQPAYSAQYQPPPQKAKKWPWVVGAFVLLSIIGSCQGKDDRGSSSAAGSGSPLAAVTAPAGAGQSGASGSGASSGYNGYGATTKKFGEEAEAGDMIVSAKRPQKMTKQYLGTQYCATVSYRNNGSGSDSFSPFDWNFRTADGVEVSASIPFNADKALNTGSLNAGGRTSGQVCADSNTTDVTEVVYSPGFGVMHKVTFGS